MDKFTKAKAILKKYNFIYELLGSGNLIAEPMNFGIQGKITRELQDAGYFVLYDSFHYVIKVCDEDEQFIEVKEK